MSIGLRTGVCLVAMWLVLRSVRLDDWATLPDASEVQILNWADVAADERLNDPTAILAVEVVVAGQPSTLALGDLARDAGGQPEFHIGLRSAMEQCDWFLMAIALLVFAPVPILQSMRFTWMVRAQDIALTHWDGIKLSFAGNFLNFVAIGSTGGDIFKAYYVACHTTRKTEAVTTVLLDRALGLISLLIIALVAMVVRFDDPSLRRFFPVIALMVIGLIIGVIIVFSTAVRERLGIDRLLARLPFSDQIRRIDNATVRMRHHLPLVTSAILMTLVLQGLAILSFMIAGQALGMRGGSEYYAGYFAYLAMGLLIAAVPISYQGVGTMDAALQVFLGGVFGNYSQILFLGFAIRLIQLAWALPGFIVPLTGAHRPSTAKTAQSTTLAPSSES